MILEPIRLMADWYAREDFGVNKKLEALPLWPDDDRPPPIVGIIDATRKPTVSPGMDWPLLMLSLDLPATTEGEVGTATRDATRLTLTTAYFTGDPDGEDAAAQTLYTLRATVQSLREWLRNDNEAERTKNGITVLTCLGMQWGPLREDMEGGAVTGAVVTDLRVRDVQP